MRVRLLRHKVIVYLNHSFCLRRFSKCDFSKSKNHILKLSYRTFHIYYVYTLT